MERQHKELIDISIYMLKKNKEMDELIQSVPINFSKLSHENRGRRTAPDDSIEKINLRAKVKEQQLALIDFKERCKLRKSQCIKLEEDANLRQEKANYFQEQLKVVESGQLSQEQKLKADDEHVEDQLSTVGDLKVQLKAERRQNE